MRILICILLLVPFSAFCQINFVKNIPWAEASDRARAENKLIFVHIDNAECQRCNQVASEGFASSLLKEKFEQNFISVRMDADNANIPSWRRQLHEAKMFSIFLDSNGNILHSLDRTTNSPIYYAEQADIALKAREGKQLDYYEKEYQNGNRSLQFLEEYIAKRSKVGLPVDPLLDFYVGQLPVDSLRNFRIVKFIYSQGFSLDSRAYKVTQAVTHPFLIQALYKTIPVAEAKAINGRIIDKTFKTAVSKRDTALVRQLATFERGAFTDDVVKGKIAYDRRFLTYYFTIRDTTRYLSEATRFLSRYHMQLTVDSLRKMDDSERRNQGFSKPTDGQQSSVQTVVFSPPSQYYHMELNNHAWNFFKMASKPTELEMALAWSRQSMLFFDELSRTMGHPMSSGNPAYMDTYAQLLYKLGRKEEAIEWQTKAVEAERVSGRKPDSYESTLTKMRAGN